MSRLVDKNPGRSILGILFYDLIWNIARLIARICFRYRVFHEVPIPPTGPVIIVANHQSNLDPPMVCFAFSNRHTNFIAKSGLFRVPGLGWLISNLNSIPIKQDATDTAAIRTALDVLDKKRLLLLFPEGSRTSSGQMGEFKRGAWLLMSKAKCPIVPVGVDGTFDALPPRAKFPKLPRRRVTVFTGPAIDSATLLAMGHAEGLKFLQRDCERLRVRAQQELLSRGGISTTTPLPPESVEIHIQSQPQTQAL